MENPLSPFLPNLFMSRFESETIQMLQYFPGIWLRYVDDIFAVFDTKKSYVEDFVSKLNDILPTIKFSFDQENKKQLPFLDVLVTRNKEKLEFDVFWKETSTYRYILNSSYHCRQHKMARFKTF